MSIEKNQYKDILNDLDIGNSIAEYDSILEAARVETPTFDGVLADRYDFIIGRKGAGKTAIFKILNIISSVLLKQRKLIILSGVNSRGEPIFNQFKKRLSKFSEQDFETFWKFYFISLIYNDFIKNNNFSESLDQHKKEIDKFINECEKAGIPNIPKKQDKNQMIEWILRIFSKKIKGIGAEFSFDPSTPNLFKIKPKIDFEDRVDSKKKKKEGKSVYVHAIGEALSDLLKKSDFRIWIILDRLDEVFERYSGTEFRGLRGLLIAYKNFIIDGGSDLFRIKLFLRDDIVSFLTDDKVYKKYFRQGNIPPLPAATHIFAKQSPTLNWDEDEIEQLILNRLMLSEKLCLYLDVPKEQIDKNIKDLLRSKGQRQTYWNKIFPKTIQTSPSLKWIFTRLKDANGIVTPRSVIDTLEGAINYQKKKMVVDFKDREEIFSVDSIKGGLKIASINKLEKDIYNEFPKEQESIKRLSKFGKIKLTKSELQKIYGKNWEEIVFNLNRIGIIRYVKDSSTYRVEFLFRPALKMAYSS